MATTNTNDPVEVTRVLVKEALEPHIKGKNKDKRLKDATDDVVASITHLLKTEPAKKKRLGATIMTESASMKNPHTGGHSVPPRTI